MKYYLPLCLLVALTALLAFSQKKETVHYKTIVATMPVLQSHKAPLLASATSSPYKIVPCPDGSTHCDLSPTGTDCWTFTLCQPTLPLKSVVCEGDRSRISCNTSNLGPTCTVASSCPQVLKVYTCPQGPIGCALNGTGSACPSLMYCPPLD